MSGFDKINESGWWKLTYSQNTRFYSNMYENIHQKKSFKFEKLDRLATEDINVVDLYPSDVEDNNGSKRSKPEEIFSRTLPYMGRPQRVFARRQTVDLLQRTNASSENDSESIHSNLTDFIANELSNSALLDEISNLNSVESLNAENSLFLDDEQINWSLGDLSNFDMNNLPNLIKSEDAGEFSALINTTPLTTSVKNENHNEFSYVENEMFKIFEAEQQNSLINRYEYPEDEDDEPGEEEEEDMMLSPRIIQVTNFQEADDSTTAALDVHHPQLMMFFKSEPQSDDDNYVDHRGDDDDGRPHRKEVVCEKSLFRVSRKRDYPWLTAGEPSKRENKEDDISDDRIHAMGAYNEDLLHKKLKPMIENEFRVDGIKVPTWIRRLYRKLSVRQLKRFIRRSIFNFDDYSTMRVRPNNTTEYNILDRYYHVSISIK